MRWVSLERLRVAAARGWQPQLTSAAIFGVPGGCSCRCITDPAEWCHICNPRSSVPCSAQVMCPHWERWKEIMAWETT